MMPLTYTQEEAFLHPRSGEGRGQPASQFVLKNKGDILTALL